MNRTPEGPWKQWTISVQKVCCPQSNGVMFPAAQHHCLLVSTTLHCLMTCTEICVRAVTWQWSRLPSPTIRPQRHNNVLCYKYIKVKQPKSVISREKHALVNKSTQMLIQNGVYREICCTCFHDTVLSSDFIANAITLRPLLVYLCSVALNSSGTTTSPVLSSMLLLLLLYLGSC